MRGGGSANIAAMKNKVQVRHSIGPNTLLVNALDMDHKNHCHRCDHDNIIVAFDIRKKSISESLIRR